MVIVLSFAHVRKTVLNDYTPEFLSPAKLNNKI